MDDFTPKIKILPYYFMRQIFIFRRFFEMKTKTVKALVESAVMVALATVLSFLKIVDLPYGGSVTLASMLPIAIIAYRHGAGWGLGAGLVNAVIQQLLGLKNLSYATTWQAALAIIMLDYIIAFTVVGLAGVFRKAVKNQAASLTLGCVLACVLRYICHVAVGATVWAGLSIPTQAALSYSFIYNATYMLPETIILVVAALYLGSTVDFRAEMPTRIKQQSVPETAAWTAPVAGLSIVVAVIFDVSSVFRHLQDAETGEFTITKIADVDWVGVIVVTVCAVFISAIALAIRNAAKKKNA